MDRMRGLHGMQNKLGVGRWQYLQGAGAVNSGLWWWWWWSMWVMKHHIQTERRMESDVTKSRRNTDAGANGGDI